MPPDENGDETPPKEPNLYRRTLVSAKSTIETCGDNVYSGYGSPLDAIANPVSTGGWVCSEADAWIAEMQAACSGIPAAFDDAAADVQQAISAEDALFPNQEVPENHPHGNAWTQTWHTIQHNL